MTARASSKRLDARSADTKIAEAIKTFWENSRLYALRRAADRVWAGEPIEERDRDIVALTLVCAKTDELKRIVSTWKKNPSAIAAEVALHLIDSGVNERLARAAVRRGGHTSAKPLRQAMDRLKLRRSGLTSRKEKRRGGAIKRADLAFYKEILGIKKGPQ